MSFAVVPDDVVARSHEVTGHEFKVYIYYLLKRDTKTGVCWPSVRVTAAALSMPFQRVGEARLGLLEKRWIAIEAEKHGRTPVIRPLVGFPASVTESVTLPSRKPGHSTVTKNVTVTESVTVESHEKRDTCVTETVKRINRLNKPMNRPEESSSSLNEQLLKPVTKTKTCRASAAAVSIGEYWKIRLNHPNAVLDEKRLRPVDARKADGFTDDQLKAAIDGCARSEFHQGVNDNGRIYDDLSLICRDAAHVEQFIAIGDPNVRRQERPIPLTANGRRLRDSLEGIARRARGDNGGDHSAVALSERLTLLR